jgi:ribosomal protein L34
MKRAGEEKKKSKSGFRRRARATGGKVAVISFRFKDVDIIDVGLIVED